MSVIVTDRGFAPEDWPFGFQPPEAYGRSNNAAQAIDIAPDFDIHQLPSDFAGIDLIRLHLPNPTDGRAFSQARLLRLLGFVGRLRLWGEVMPDQYALARQVGCDEVEISAARAARQPEAQWRAALPPERDSYQARLRHFA